MHREETIVSPETNKEKTKRTKRNKTTKTKGAKGESETESAKRQHQLS